MHLVPATALLAGLIATAGVITAPFERHFFRSDLNTRAKVRVYGVLIVLLWSMTAAALSIYGWEALREAPPAARHWISSNRTAALAAGMVIAIYFLLGFQPLLQSIRGSARRQAYAAAIRRHAARFPALLPNNGVECAMFTLVGLTAGLCEEVLFRGYLTHFIQDSIPALPLIGILLLSSLLFGLNHAYQGLRGILSTAIAGLMFGAVFLLTSDLMPSILLHALMDLQVAYVLRPRAEAEIMPVPVLEGSPELMSCLYA